MPILPLTGAQRAVAALIERCSVNPHWMGDPAPWRWIRPDGRPQGFGYASPDPGLTNLLWLAMDLRHPPARYDVAANPLYMQLFFSAHTETIAGRTLADHAGLSTLAQFEELLPSKVETGTYLERSYPVLKLLAQRRLSDARD